MLVNVGVALKSVGGGDGDRTTTFGCGTGDREGERDFECDELRLLFLRLLRLRRRLLRGLLDRDRLFL